MTHPFNLWVSGYAAAFILVGIIDGLPFLAIISGVLAILNGAIAYS